MKTNCPKCSSIKYWLLKDGRFKCRQCRKTFTDRRKYLRITTATVRKVVQEFLLEHSTNVILTRVTISRYMLLKLLTLLRMVMAQDVPEVFEGTVEVDETYLGGQWKNKRLSIKRKAAQVKRGRGTTKQAVFGLSLIHISEPTRLC